MRICGYLFVVFVAVGVVGGPKAQACLGQTRAQCEVLWGKPVPTQAENDTVFFVISDDLIVGVQFRDDKATTLFFQNKKRSADVAEELSDTQIQELLVDFSQGHQWSRDDNGWTRDDGQRVASYVGRQKILLMMTKDQFDRERASMILRRLRPMLGGAFAVLLCLLGYSRFRSRNDPKQSLPQEFPISIPGFEGRGLAYRAAGTWSGGNLLLDGQALKRRWSWQPYLLRDNVGREVQVRLRHNPVDTVPRIEADGKVINLLPPLKFYEYVFCGIPLVLLHLGGGLGGLLGALASYRNVRTFRSERSLRTKYAVVTLTTGATILIWLVAAVIVELLLTEFG